MHNSGEVRGEIDGFFGLFIDNVLQMVLIYVFCHGLCGIPQEFIYGTIFPGAALSILVGNLFYGWQAWKLGKKEGRDDVTALPYGINTVSLIAFVFFVMLPVYHIEGDWRKAWRLGLIACIGSGLIELFGAFVGDFLRRVTPRGALLAALGGIALTFISMGFVFRIFSYPVVALVPAVLIVVGYASKLTLPWHIPVGIFAVILGTAFFWCTTLLGLGPDIKLDGAIAFGLYLPQCYLNDIITGLKGYRFESFLAVVLPMGLFTIVGSLQNLESAAASGDRFNTCSSLSANSVGTLVGALLGSPFPTTIYIGHPGWKAMGARWRYSIWNGVVISLLAIFGAISCVLAFIPTEAMVGILLWIGLVMVVQSFRDVEPSHYYGVVFGLIPSLAAWALILIDTTARVAGASLYSLRTQLIGQELFLDGVIALNQGFIISSSIFASIVIFATERKYMVAGYWGIVAAGLSWFGVIHGYELHESGILYSLKWVSSPSFSVAYLLISLMFLLLSCFSESRGSVAERQK